MNISKKSSFAVLLAALSLVVTGCDNGNNNGNKGDFKVTGPYFTGKAAKKDYKAFLGSGITTLNYTESQNGADAKHVANFVTGLVMNDNYGILRNQIAKSATHDADYKVFTFEIRDDVYWYTNTGEVFTNEGQKQKVVADDWVNSAEIILNNANGSDLYYLVAMFLKGGWEYYCYTLMQQLIRSNKKYPDTGKTDPDGYSYSASNPAPDKNCRFDYKTLKNASNDQIAAQLTNLIAYESNVSEAEALVLGSELQDIKDFKRVGVKAEGNTLTYTLTDGMAFFPTALTYCAFLPVNRAFYAQQKSKNFGTGADKLLYNGPYLLDKWEGSEIVYKKNNGYFDVDKVHIDTVQYKVLEETVSPSYTREQFENGTIDGFSIGKSDTEGWKMYIGGEDGTGTYQNPIGITGPNGEHYADFVNARELDEIDYLYSFNVNMNRDTEFYTADQGKADVTAAEIRNANAALHIKEVRQLLLDGVDLDRYGQVYVDNWGTERTDTYAVNTLIPKGFALDENDKDYVEYFFEEYASQKNISVDESRNMWKQQQYTGIGYEDSEYERYVEERQQPALRAIEKYNEAVRAGTLKNQNGEIITEEITFPIKFETLTSGALNSDYKKYDNMWIENLNEKMNGCRIYKAGQYSDASLDLPESTYLVDGAPEYPYFIVLGNSKVTSATESTYSYGAYYNFGLVMGWGPDYADPLTYMNCYVENGDMTQYCGYTADDLTYYLDDSGNIQSKEIAQEYTDMVVDAKHETSDTKLRYEKFAAAEYVLHEDMKVVRPAHMDTQGWTASVARIIGYENPSATYGLAGQMMVGEWVLIDVPTAAERVAARAKQAELKAEEIAKTGLIAIYGE